MFTKYCPCLQAHQHRICNWIKSDCSKAHGQETAKWTSQLKHSGHYCELFMCRDAWFHNFRHELCNKIVCAEPISNSFCHFCGSLVTTSKTYNSVFPSLLSCYITQYTCIYLTHLALTLCSTGLPLWIFSIWTAHTGNNF